MPKGGQARGNALDRYVRIFPMAGIRLSLFCYLNKGGGAYESSPELKLILKYLYSFFLGNETNRPDPGQKALHLGVARRGGLKKYPLKTEKTVPSAKARGFSK